MKNKALQIYQLDAKFNALTGIDESIIPATGWIKSIRNGIGMSLQQLGQKLAVTKQRITDIEKGEVEGTITLNTLRKVADAMEMKLVYGIIPKDGSLEALIDNKAHEIAKKIVLRTATTMQLEDQAVSQLRIESSIKERAEIIKNEMPKILWD